MRERAGFVLVALVGLFCVFAISGCNVGAGFAPNAGIWGLNESSNNYLIRIWTAASPGDRARTALQTWAFPARSAGFVATGRNMDVEVLDTSTCSHVASLAVSGNLLVSVDERGRVDFLAQPEAPAMDIELEPSDACGLATPTSPEVTS